MREIIKEIETYLTRQTNKQRYITIRLAVFN